MANKKIGSNVSKRFIAMLALIMLFVLGTITLIQEALMAPEVMWPIAALGTGGAVMTGVEKFRKNYPDEE